MRVRLKIILLFLLLMFFSRPDCIHAQLPDVRIEKLGSLSSPFKERSYGSALDSHGNLYIAGSTEDEIDFDPDTGVFKGENYQVPGYYFAKYDSAHTIEWAYHTGYPTYQMSISACTVDHSEHPILAGWYRGLPDIDFRPSSTEYMTLSASNYSFYIARFDSTGAILTHTEFISLPDSFNRLVGDRSYITDLKTDNQNNIYVTGYCGDVIVHNDLPGDTLREFNHFVIKLDSNCHVTWMHRLKKTVEEFHNWTNWIFLPISIDEQGDIYLTYSFTDSLNVKFEHETPLYLYATPYDYPNPPIRESSNIDLVILHYDKDGNYKNHRHIHSDDISRQRQLGSILLENSRLIVLCAFDGKIDLPDTTFTSIGTDAYYDYNLVLMECDTALNILKHQLYHVNILSPREGPNYLQGDACGNLLMRTDLVLVNSSPFPPFGNPSIPFLQKENLYFFNHRLQLSDSIVVPNFHLADYYSVSMKYGQIVLYGTYQNIFSLGPFYIQEQNYVPSSAYYDSFLAYFLYNGCDRPSAETKDSVIQFPNVFTPNSDGLNSEFRPKYIPKNGSVQLLIYNRWGKEIFKSRGPNDWWNGQNNNFTECSEGEYYYIATYTGTGGNKKFHGVVSLLR